MNKKPMIWTMLTVGMVAAAPVVAAGHVEPTFVEGRGNLTCSDFQPKGAEWQELKVDPAMNGTFAHASGNLTILLDVEYNDEGEPKSFNWTATDDEVVAVFVKAGSKGGHNLYEYPGGETSDTNLTSPQETGNAISHISFCFAYAGGDEPDPEPEPVCRPGELAARANGDGSVTVDVSNLTGDASLLRSAGDGAPVKVADLNETATQYVDTDTTVGVTYTYTLAIDDQRCGSVEVTAIPVFPSVLAATLAIAASLAGYAMLRRR